jgi:uncharacterized membrane protein
MKLLHIILIGIIMLFLDSIYLSTFSGFYNNIIKSIQGTTIQFKLSGAVLCYLFLIYGLYYFIISQKRSIKDAFLLGIIIYGVYETTNYAIIDKWDPKAVVLDTLWGGILFATTTAIVYKITMNWGE